MKKQLLAIFASGLTLLITMIGLLPKAVTAQPPLPDIEMVRKRWWIGDLPPIAGFTPTVEKSSPVHPLGNLADWSRIAFQSYRDGNWEIYLARGDGTQPVRLTHHPAADVRPRLNRGATRLAFTSDRDGNWEIYTINTDGSGLARLTFNDANDAGPVWSPDGRRIAFASDRDGNWEIYVMNADGLDQTRLTYNDADDIMPAWSSDGNRIAWVRMSGPNGALWVMSADGTIQRAVLSGLRFLQNPRWSPDLRFPDQLVFDYDCDGDLWNELAEASIGRTPGCVYDAAQDLVDTWMGSWSPDGRWLLFSRVEYVLRDNKLFLRNAYVERVPTAGGPTERLLPLGVDLLPDWQTTDVSPPWVHLQRLPRYLRSPHGAVTLSWSGEDVGPAGLGGYEVQWWKEDLGDWGTWLRDTQDTTAHFVGTPGETYAFRVRARDNAWNVSPWSGGLWNRTTLYAWHLTGLVSDNRGIPLSGAVVETTPSSINAASSGFDGRFRVYLAQMASTTVSVRLQGYSELPAVTFSGAQDVVHWWALPPVDDQLVNGGFEQGNLNPWQSSESSAAVLDWTAAHTGDASVKLGQPPALEIINLSNNADHSGLFGPPRIVHDPAGNLHVVWSDMTTIPGDMRPYAGDLFYSMRPPDSDWTSPTIIVPEHPGGAGWPEAAMGPDGTVHVVWLEEFSEETSGTRKQKIGYTFKPPGGTWSAMTDLSGAFPAPPYSLPRPTPMIAVDGQGGVHVVWSDGEGIWYTAKRRDASWSDPVEVFPTGDMPTVAVGPDDQVHLIWRERSSGDLFYSRRLLDGSWSTPINLTRRSGIRYGPRLTVDPQRNVHLVWVDTTHFPASLFYMRRTADGQWSEPIGIVEGDNTSPLTVYLTADPDGRLHVAWSAMDWPNNLWSEVRYRIRSPEGLWSAPIRLSHAQQRADGPGVWADEGGMAHVVWFEEPTFVNAEVMYTEVNLTRATEAALSQTVTLPSSLHRPTLSFAYMLDIAAETGASLSAEVNGAPVFSSTVPAADWTHVWVDLTPWAAQTVTVSFRVHGTSTSGPVIAHLDDVSLGSWLTPVVHNVSPAHVETRPVPITITGENFIETPTVRLNETALEDVQWIDEHTLRVTLPADLPPGVYDVWVTNPGGQKTGVSRRLHVGKQVYLPVLFRGYALID